MGQVNWEIALQNAAGSAEILRGLLADCTAEAPRLMRQLTDALERGDAAAARRAAHTLRSFSRLFGADAVGTAAGSMESLVGSGQIASARELLAGLNCEVAEVVAEVEARLRGGEGMGQP